MIEELRRVNQIKISEISSEGFKTYGRVVKDYDFSPFINYSMENTVAGEGVTYQRSILGLEDLPLKAQVEREIYGELPIQVGWCFGHNRRLNGLEYHKGNEVIVAATDLLLLLGRLQDIKDFVYESKRVSAFFMPAGLAVELYSTTLHFAPINVHPEGFTAIIILPFMTNAPLGNSCNRKGENKLLFARNKWLIAHKTADVVEKGAYIGILGENIEIKIPEEKTEI